MKYPTIHIDQMLNGKAVEWERLEFKAGWNPLDVLHTVCAFANDFHNLGGGYIVVGVAEQDGRPVLPAVGLDGAQLNAIQKEILNLGHHAIQPQYHPIVVPETLNGRHVLETGVVPSLSQVCPKSVPTDTARSVLDTVQPPADLQTLMAKTGHTNRTRFRNAVLKPLIATGLIEMTIPDKPRSSKQKYRLTAKGHSILARKTEES